jgi:hypothetical protein
MSTTEKTHGDRGKWAEKQIQDLLIAFNRKWIDVTYHRLPDARAARGALAAQPADFIVAAHGHGYFLEVKETQELHRLPRDKVKQIPDLRKFALAGMGFAVLVFHSAMEKWRCVPQDVFMSDAFPTVYDLSHLELYDTPEAALLATNWFIHK